MSWAEAIADLVEAIKDPIARYLKHDSAYFKAVKKAKLHGGLLDGVREYDVR